MTKTAVKAHIYKMTSHEPYPWVYEVDFLNAQGKRDTSIDSLDYGNMATHADALEQARLVMESY